MYNTDQLIRINNFDLNQFASETIKNINTLISKLPKRSTERVKAAQWVKKLKQLDDQSVLRDQYLQLLFSQLSENRLSSPFLTQHTSQPLVPLGYSKQPLCNQHSITPPELSRSYEARNYIPKRSNSISMSVPFQNGASHLTPPTRHRQTYMASPPGDIEDLLASTERMLSKNQSKYDTRNFSRDQPLTGQDTFLNSHLLEEEPPDHFTSIFNTHLSSPDLSLSDRSLGEEKGGQRLSDVSNLIGGRIGTKTHGHRTRAKTGTNQRERAKGRHFVPPVEEDSVRMLLDDKNSELESTKLSFSSKLREFGSRCHRLEERLRQREEELAREREGTRERMEEQKIAWEKRQNAIKKEFELKMQQFIDENEDEKGDIHKQHAKKLSAVMNSTQDQRLKIESEYAKQARSTNRIVQELEVRVKQLTEEVANEVKSRTRLLKEKSELDQKVQSLRQHLDTSATQLEDLELEKREYLSDYEANLRKLQTQLEQTIQLARQEQNSCVQKYATKTQELEQHLSQFRNALENSNSEKQKLESQVDQLTRDLRNRDVQLESKVKQAKTEIEQIESRYKQKLRRVECVAKEKDDTILELQELGAQQSQQAQISLDQFKSQFEKNSTEIYHQMKKQMEKAEQDLQTSRQVRDKQTKDFIRQRDEERKQHNKDIEVLKIKWGKEKHQILKETAEKCEKLETHLANEKEKLLRAGQDRIQKSEMEFRLKIQDSSNKITQLECKLKETKDQLTNQLSQQKSQLLELSLLREDEKKSSHRSHQNIINKFKAEMEEQRRQLDNQHSERTHHLQEQTSGRVQELESNHQEQQIRSQQKISSLESEAKYLKEDLSRSKAAYEEHISENVSRHERSLEEVRKSHEASIRSLQQESETNRDMATQIEKRCQQLELESDQKSTQSRLRYEEKLSGLLPNSIRKELEDTIVSLKAQVSSLNERCILLQEQVAKKRSKF